MDQIELPIDYTESENYHIRLSRSAALAKTGEYTNKWYYIFRDYISKNGRLPDNIGEFDAPQT